MAELNRDVMLAELSRAAERWSEWRAARKMGTRFPGPLWDLAVELAAKYGVNRTAAALRIGYDSLKKRCQTAASTASEKSESASEFVELRPVAVESRTAVGDCLIEFEKSSGARMRVRVSGVRLSDLVTLSRSFWESP